MVYVPCLTLLKVHGSGYNSFINIVYVIYSYDNIISYVWTFVETTAFTSSAINPWVYCLRNDEFYEALSRTFRFLKRR